MIKPAPVKSTAIGIRIRELREEAGLSQRQLAEKAGLASAHISFIESGKFKNPRLNTILKISVALGASMEDLCDEDR